MDQPITPFDLQRMFFGDYPPLFYAEVAFRITVIYGYTLVLIRWIGARGVAQLSMIEFLLVIAIGSAVGDSLFYPDVPLIPAMLAILLVVVFNKLIDQIILRSARATRVLEGSPQVVVTDGQVHVGKLKKQGISPPELFMKLRDKGVTDLAEVRFAVLEANGAVSVLSHTGDDQPAVAGLFGAPAIPAEELLRPANPPTR